MNQQKRRTAGAFRRKMRVRNRIRASRNYKPRLSVNKTTNHIYVQLIDDIKGKTLAAAATVDKEIRSKHKHCGNIKAAKDVGVLIAKRAIAAGVTEVAFDRGPFKFHGCIKALADAARETGLKF